MRRLVSVVVLVILLVPSLARAQVHVMLPGVEGRPGETVQIPVTVSDLEGPDVVAYGFTITYDPDVVRLRGVSAAGTLSSGMTVAANEPTPGRFKVGAAAAEPVIGAGPLLLLEAEYVALGESDLSWSGVEFNNGIPAAAPVDGSVRVAAASNVRQRRQPVPPGDPPPLTLGDVGVRIDFASLGHAAELLVQRRTDAGLHDAPAGFSFVEGAVWTLDLDGAARFEAEVCLALAALADPGAASDLRVLKRSGAGAPWRPQPTVLRPFADDARWVCALGVDGFSDFAVARAAVPATPNTAPTAADDAATTAEDTAARIAVLDNDADPDGDVLVVLSVGAPDHGTAVVEGDTVVYTPAPDYHGSDAFTYTVGDGRTEVQARVAVTVEPVDDAPVFTTSPVFVTPADGAEVVVGADGGDPAGPAAPFVAEWHPAWDAEGAAVTYVWQLATADRFAAADVVAAVDAGTDTRAGLTVGFLDSLLAERHVPLGGALTLYHRVLASDGALVGTTEAARVTLVRGAVATAVEDAVTPDARMPDAVTLHPNHPNPFHASTAIRYALPRPARVTLAVHDALGREVAVLVDGSRPAGLHAVRFDARGLPSGVYLYRLRTGDVARTRRMLLVR